MLVTWNGQDEPLLGGYRAKASDADCYLGNVFPGGSPTPTPKNVTTPHRYVNYDSSRGGGGMNSYSMSQMAGGQG